MTEIPLRELRNNASEVLRRVEDGEELDVTVNGRTVARLIPTPRRPTFRPLRALVAHPADRAMLDDIQELRGDDNLADLKDPWERYGR
ncbi:MAG TPA: type II toxin-antitoxin system prevent-host-death family antitoxin [Pseudonocardia sp.]|uniref:type II toxin-antitoxin system Phd/YefM family antitoxin n=1 Tax=Pseudonocardia sp. TaxID=60912 RepID=UPI002ED96E74